MHHALARNEVEKAGVAITAACVRGI